MVFSPEATHILLINNMNLLDYFFYVLVNGQMKVLKKDEWYSIISAGGIIGVIVAWFIISILFTLGLLIKSYWLADKLVYTINFQFFFTLAIIALPLIHYWRYENDEKFKYSDIVNRRNSMNKHLRLIYYIVFLLSMIGVPILFFVTYRLYKFGQVAWW